MIPSAGATPTQDSTPIYKELIRFNFDSVSDGTLTSYMENGVSIYIDNKETAYLEGNNAPSGKLEGSSLSDGETDRVMSFKLGNKSQNPNIRLTFPNSVFKGNLKLTYNYYVPSCTSASYGLFNTDIRNSSDNQSYNVLMSLRGNKNFQYCPTVNSSTNNGTFATGKWYQAEIFIDAQTRTYDLYVNGALKGEDCALKSDTVFNEIRFSTNNTSQNLSNTYVYLDDVYMGVETQRPTPVFVATTHKSGTDNSSLLNVPKDMTGIKVQFPFDMDEASFKGNVTLTRENGKTVPFEGVYNKDDKSFTLTLGENAFPCTEYTLTFGEDIKTSDTQTDIRYAGVYLTTPQSISITTEKVDFAILNSAFSSDELGEEVTDAVLAGTQKIYGGVDVVSSDLLEGSKKVAVILLCYQNGMLEKTFIKPYTIGETSEIKREHLYVEADLSKITVNADTHFELLVWDEYMNMLPLFGNTQISGQ